jgi:pimeloyl-ACP methyl ester carboxylesterase
LFEHQIKNLADIATSEVLVLNTQDTRVEMAEHVLAVAPQRFSIAGHSLGGWVAQEVAARAPERVSKLFLCDTLARKPEGTDEYLRNYWTHAERDLDGALTEQFHLLYEDRYADEAFCGRLQRWQREMAAGEYIRQLKALAADYSTEDLLPRITADTLVIHGRQDRVVPEEEVEFLADGIARAALALIEEAGHCSPIAQPQAFTAVMRLWLTQ